MCTGKGNEPVRKKLNSFKGELAKTGRCHAHSGLVWENKANYSHPSKIKTSFKASRIPQEFLNLEE
jgi:hypothetical protein